MNRFKFLREELRQFSIWCRENSVTADDQASEIAYLYLKIAEIKEDISELFKNQ